MSFGWLENLGSNIASGLKKIPGAIKKIPGALGDEDAMPHTGGFAGGDPAGDLMRGKSQLPQRQGIPPMPQGNDAAWWKSQTPDQQSGRLRDTLMGGQQSPQLPTIGRDQGPPMPMARLTSPSQTMDQVSTSTQPGAIPTQIPTRTVPLPRPQMTPPVPQMNEGQMQQFDAMVDQDRGTRPNVVMAQQPDVRAQDIAPPSLPGRQFTPNDDRRNVPIPNLPSMKGGTTPYTDRGAAQYDQVMAHATPNADGQRVGKIQSSWKNVAQNALLGAAGADPRGGLAGMLGGAIGGGLGAKFNPEVGQQRVFEAGPGRRMDQEQGRQDQLAQHRAEMEKARLNNEHIAAQTAALKTGKARDRFIPVSGGGLYDTENDYFVRDPNEPKTSATAPHYVEGTVDGKPGWYNVADPELKGKVGPYDKQGTQARPRRYNIDGKLVDDNGNVVYDAGRGEKPNAQRATAINNAQKEHRTLKSEYTAADAAYQAAQKNLLKSPDDSDVKTTYEKALALREARLQKLNSHAQSVSEQFPDELEGGVGQGGVGYVKPKGGGAKATPSRSGGAKGPTAKLSDLTKYLQ